MVKGDYLISAMVKLLPVTAWGTVYLAITLKRSPYILVTACVDGTEIEVHLNVAKFRKVRVPKKSLFRKRPTYQFTLDMYQSYSASSCIESQKMEDSGFTGTKIMATEPVGVITGSCLGRTLSYQTKTQDIMIESGYPKKYFGQEFILFVPTAQMLDLEKPKGQLLVIAIEADTDVTLGGAATATLTLKNEGDKEEMVYTDHQVLKTTRPASVYLILCCQNDPNGQNVRSVSILVPDELFANLYTMRQILPKSSTIIYFVVIYKKLSTFVDEMNAVVKIFNPNDVMGNENWQVGFIPVRSSFATLHTNHWASFGCYLWQQSNSSCSVTFADFDAKTFPVRRKRQEKNDKVKDGKLNETSKAEEERNTTKTPTPKVCTEGCQDAGPKEEEELMPKVVHGNWATWEEWLCTENCNASHQERRRFCDDPAPAFGGEQCSGDNIESRASNCYKNKSDCPTDCPKQWWGEGCARHCPNCAGDCDKFNGSCSDCEPGYRVPYRGCKQRCHSLWYGPGCNFSCLSKCGDICTDSVTGDCPKVYLLPWIILAICVIVPCGILICGIHMEKHRESYTESWSDTRTSYTISKDYSGISETLISVMSTMEDFNTRPDIPPIRDDQMSRRSSILLQALWTTQPVVETVPKEKPKSVLPRQYQHEYQNQHYHIGSKHHLRDQHKRKDKEDDMTEDYEDSESAE
ncbi:uncharacterized protein LOC106064768 [Biomphalaria glabrata]|uniref:Uncharacterized protein LOC106064768 n=1 Tax=Biomphalaria glabrata TaxID=6526 RepID=A0A9W2ZCK0_BIOGL|nr:uncharacterized protein LOC106064768 [Biomphalaria glabrata]